MSERWLRNFLAVCFVVLFWAALLLIAGCAGPALKLEVESDKGSQSKTVMLETRYELENGGKFYRNPETGELTVELGSATTGDMDAGMWSFLLQMLQMMQATYMGTMQPAMIPPAQPEPN